MIKDKITDNTFNPYQKVFIIACKRERVANKREKTGGENTHRYPKKREERREYAATY